MNETSISVLPDELLELIFSFLPFAEWKIARFVSCHWRDVSYSYRLIRKVEITLPHYRDLQQLNLNGRFSNIRIIQVENMDRHDGLYDEDTSCDEFWVKCGEFVRHLTMFYGDEQSQFLQKVFPNTPNLESLSLCDNDGENQVEMWNVECFEIPSLPPISFPNLKSLTINYRQDVNGYRFRRLVENAPMLQQVSLRSFFRHFVGVKELFVALERFTYRQGKILNRLSLDFFDLSDSDLEKILLNLGPQMVELHLPGCNKISDISLPLIQKRLPNLQKITLSNTGCTDEGFHDLLKSLKHVTHVYLEWTRVYEMTAALLPSLTQLKVLALNGSVRFRFDEQCVRRAFCTVQLPQLTELNLTSFNLTDKLVEDIVPFLPNLKALYLDSCPRLTDEAVVHIATWCKKLNTLSLQYCCGIEDISPLTGLEELQYLDLTCCPISDGVWNQCSDKLQSVVVQRSCCLWLQETEDFYVSSIYDYN